MTAAITRDDLPLATDPVVTARQLSLRTKRGWVFRDVDLTLGEGETLALAGPAGSGRSMLLLTLAGRAKPTSGSLDVAGAARRGRIRTVASVARITGAVELEPDLRVIDHVREVQLLSHRALDYRHAAELVGFTADGTTFVGDLSADEATLLAVALAVTGQPKLLVLDDADVGATPDQQHRIWAALVGLRSAGIAVVASTVDGGIAADHGARLLTLPVHGEFGEIAAHEPAAESVAEPTAEPTTAESTAESTTRIADPTAPIVQEDSTDASD
ncbi:MAG TPA: ATP-binding cassette domain-containing protein [Pseudonocardiaceae bacterium]|jgi:ABC-type multidrug transport system ATPase subunit|nr:ATP-binding cassette domain-containing protein [Pseudonocardiaceae bacterium]